ncbi:MAG: hypothetical protein R6U43_03300 [Candidatus Krumholzibacteriales bacterium]
MQKRSTVAVLIDVDGTLASPYRNGIRTIRPSALEAVRFLSEQAAVFLWSHSGSENGQRLLEEFPELEEFISGSYGKHDFPRDQFIEIYCIDDEEVDPQVLAENRIILESSYTGGDDTEELIEAAGLILEDIISNGE